jgi:DNA-binding MarR family transcriptional regulator
MSTNPMFDGEAVARLRRVIGRLGRLLNESASNEGLTPTQASVLGVIVARAPIGLSELAEFEGLNPTMLSRIVGRLDSEGLIRRTPSPNDQRATLVEATDSGRATNLRIRETRTVTVTKILDGLEPEVATVLHAALPALEALASGLSAPKQSA